MVELKIEQMYDENGQYLGGTVNTTHYDVIKITHYDSGRVMICCCNKDKDEMEKDVYGFGMYGPYIREKSPKEKERENKLIITYETHISNVIITAHFAQKEKDLDAE